MINHPMLMPRDPAPVIDVTRPALPKYRPFSQRYGYTDAEGKITAKGLATLIVDAAESAAQVPESVGSRPVVTEQAPAAADPDGWIEWKGGACPVAGDVEVRFRNGDTHRAIARAIGWEDSYDTASVVAYKVLP